MKKNFLSYIIVGSGLVMIQPACKNITDIAPQNSISSEVAFETPARIEADVLGVYDGLQSAEFLSGRSLIYSDVLGQDVIITNSYFNTIYTYTMQSTDTYAANEWSAGYTAIARANRVIEGIQANPSVLDSKTAASDIGECKFARALSYLTLVNHFAQPYNFTAGATHLGVPLILTSATSFSAANQVLRNTVAEVYAQIITDLKDAEANISNTTASDPSRASKLAASALLARVYLYMGDYANAKTQAEKVINSGAYALNADPTLTFGPDHYTTKESIFSIRNSTNDNPNTNNALPMHYGAVGLGGRGDLVISKTFLNLPGFAQDDKRRQLIYSDTVSNVVSFYNGKYPDVSGRADWAPIIRYPEMLLTAAEAQVRGGGAVDATALARLNQVRDRSRVSAPQYTLATFGGNAQSFLSAVELERRIELSFEGHRIQDILRLKENVTGKEKIDYTPMPDQAYGSNNVIFPIPSYDLQLDPKLQQNPGY